MGTIQAHQNMIFQKANTNVLWVVAGYIRLILGRLSKETTFEENRLWKREKGQPQLLPGLLSVFSRQCYFTSLEPSGYQPGDL